MGNPVAHLPCPNNANCPELHAPYPAKL
jgi:hypothetical protein